MIQNSFKATLGVFVILLLSAPSARASLKVRYNADAGGVPVPDTTLEQANGMISFNGGDGSTQPSFDPNNPTLQTASYILGARHGALRAASLAVLSGGQSYSALASVGAQASFLDMITVDDPSLTGQHGTVQVAMLLDGVMSESLSGNETDFGKARAFATFILSAETSRGNPVEVVNFGESDEEDGYSVEETILLDIPIVFGEPFMLSASMATSGRVEMPNFPGTTSAIAAFARTASWDGVTSVSEDAGGTMATNYSITSESLTDYSVPITIPEPTSLLLALVAVMSGLGHRTRAC